MAGWTGGLGIRVSPGGRLWLGSGKSGIWGISGYPVPREIRGGCG